MPLKGTKKKTNTSSSSATSSKKRKNDDTTKTSSATSVGTKKTKTMMVPTTSSATSATQTSFPRTVSKNMTLLQLNDEAKARGLDLGNVKHDKAYLIQILGDGSSSVVSAQNRTTSATTKKETRGSATTKESASTTTIKNSASANTNTKNKAGGTTKGCKKPSAVISKSSNDGSKQKSTTSSKASSKKKVLPTESDANSTSSNKNSKANPAGSATSTTKTSNSKSTTPAQSKAKEASSKKSKHQDTSNKKPAKKKSSGNSSSLVISNPAVAVVSNPSSTVLVSGRQSLITTFTSPNKNDVASSKKKLLLQENQTNNHISVATVVSAFEVSTSNTTNDVSSIKETSIKNKKSKEKSNAAPNKSIKKEETKEGAPDEEARISNKLTLMELREEAKARNLDMKQLPKLKSDLLHYLVDGSIHVVKHEAYINYQALLQRVEKERPKLYDESLAKKVAADEKREQQQIKNEEKLRLEYEEEEKQKQLSRELEIKQQRALHVHDFPYVHIHPLADHSKLMLDGSPRDSECNICDNSSYEYNASFNRHTNTNSFSLDHYTIDNASINNQTPKYTCEQCDYDICEACLYKENVPEYEKKQRAKEECCQLEEERKREEETDEEEEEEEEDKEESLTEEEKLVRWNAETRFTKKIRILSNKNKNSKTPLKYTVWCSDGYEYDGWHSYEGPPDKEFDSSWTTIKDANDRAEYLFFWKNPWGIDPSEVNDDDQDNPKPEKNNGMNKWSVVPADSSRWTVGVVPSEAFPHLENSTLERHNYDDSDQSTSTSNYARGNNDSGSWDCL